MAEVQNRKKQQGEMTRRSILEATVECLDMLGYAETSLSKILDRLSVSRGALLHHFPSKEDLIVATIDWLLGRVAKEPEVSTTPKAPLNLENSLLWYWERLVDTPEGRAFLEVLMATRTDQPLADRVSEKLRAWNDRIDAAMLHTYGNTASKDEDIILIWTIWRSFVRGLIIQKQFGSSREQNAKAIKMFATLIEPYFNQSPSSGT